MLRKVRFQFRPPVQHLFTLSLYTNLDHDVPYLNNYGTMVIQVYGNNEYLKQMFVSFF